ncbi:hypothetical protein BFW38_10080 [Terasakiispira papahanaumokuakeensis]|uniref:Knr4/Smi1-like domain-containing protein n=1 Tax=Terasakiispira papahanaumokuakeensis TaxID=197479 RepID=A0A1E2VA08_9GAMM|nr:hypothetical protein [Terasakiispira papahanaumokuakeensis]ODC03840.1 hypothetical protein BFW38_10080 [Terasakiispira papahanaumokuakeensis]
MNEYLEFRHWVLNQYPLSTLEALNANAFSELCEYEPAAPDEYIDFLANFGFGEIGEGVFQIYNYPLDADDIFDEETSKGLTEYKFIADNFSGYMFAYRMSDAQGWRLVAFQGHEIEELPDNISTLMQALKREL